MKREVVVLPVRYVLGTAVVQATTRALDAEGAFVSCPHRPATGARLRLRLYLRFGSPVELESTVVEKPAPGGEPGFWISFIDPSEETLKRIAKASELPKAAPPRAAVETVEKLRKVLELRLHERVPVNLPLRFSSGGEQRLGVATNLSASGMFIRTGHPPALRETISIELSLPGEREPACARAQVVHRVTLEEARLTGRIGGAGLQFIQADDSFRERIDGYLARVRSPDL